MALSDADIARIIAATPCAVVGSYVHTFARAIEADVRAQDEALIRQLVEALEGSIAITMVKIDQRNAALIAGRARLEGKL